MIFYTKSQKANYAHIHAYAFYDLFLSEIKRQNLTDPDFQINVDIDGNVATWAFDTTDLKIQNLFQNLTIHQIFTDHQINDAIAKICHKNNLKTHLKNLNLLKSELAHIKFQTEKPEISDDSLTSDAIDFIKHRPQPRKSCYNRFMKTILTGIRINSDLTLGNFLGAMLPMVRLANRYSSTHHVNIFVPDLHSIISETDGGLQSNMLRTIRYYLAAGLELNENVHFYRQSYVPAHTELAWILNCHTSMGEALRMTQYKDKSHNGNLSTNVGIFDYPILMAADILLYSANYVPVGEDQFQHIELTRNIAERFNHKYGEIFTIPENTENQVKFMYGDTQSFALRIRDLMNPEKKMSKSAESENSKIMLADLPERIRKKIMSATTDSLADINFDFKTQPGISNLLQILAAITDTPLRDLITSWEHRSQYGELKKFVAERLVEHISNFQTKVQNITDEEIYQLLEEGEKYANQVANQKLLEAQKAVGLR